VSEFDKNMPLAGVMGWPVAHSKSPRLHGHWLARYGIRGAYLPLAVAPDHLPAALAGLIALGFRGCNVTLPHKQAVMPLLDDVSAVARRIGAVNTVSFDENGRSHGDNSDAFGFIEALRQGAPAWQPAAGPAVLLGAGGAARAIAVALLDAGVPELIILNRTQIRANALAADLGPLLRAGDWQNPASALSGAGLLVNATSLGMQGQPDLTLDLTALPTTATVMDAVYAPLETDLLAAARARGNPAVDGLGMLLHQARPGFERWFGRAPEVDGTLRQACLDE
jgi:shikimate dehydrogenase